MVKLNFFLQSFGNNSGPNTGPNSNQGGGGFMNWINSSTHGSNSGNDHPQAPIKVTS